jgi:hypothetical protein
MNSAPQVGEPLGSSTRCYLIGDQVGLFLLRGNHTLHVSHFGGTTALQTKEHLAGPLAGSTYISSDHVSYTIIPGPSYLKVTTVTSNNLPT